LKKKGGKGKGFSLAAGRRKRTNCSRSSISRTPGRDGERRRRNLFYRDLGGGEHFPSPVKGGIKAVLYLTSLREKKLLRSNRGGGEGLLHFPFFLSGRKGKKKKNTKKKNARIYLGGGEGSIFVVAVLWGGKEGGG